MHANVWLHAWKGEDVPKIKFEMNVSDVTLQYFLLYIARSKMWAKAHVQGYLLRGWNFNAPTSWNCWKTGMSGPIRWKCFHGLWDCCGSCLLQQGFLWVQRPPCPCRGACRQLPAALMNMSFWDVGKWGGWHVRVHHLIPSNRGFWAWRGLYCCFQCWQIELVCEHTPASADASSLPRLLEASPYFGTLPRCKPQQLLLSALGDPLALFAIRVTLPSAG